MSYLVTLRLRSLKDVATLFQTIDRFAIMVECQEEEKDEVDFPEPPRKRKSKVKGETAQDIILNNLPASPEKLSRILVEKGYSPTSCSPAISALKKEGKITIDSVNGYVKEIPAKVSE